MNKEYRKLEASCRELILSEYKDSNIVGMEINVRYRFFPQVRTMYLKYTRKGRKCYEYNDQRRDKIQTILIKELRYSSIWIRSMHYIWMPNMHHRINNSIPMFVRKGVVYLQDPVYVLNTNLRRVPSSDGDIDMYNNYKNKSKSKTLKKY